MKSYTFFLQDTLDNKKKDASLPHEERGFLLADYYYARKGGLDTSDIIDIFSINLYSNEKLMDKSSERSDEKKISTSIKRGENFIVNANAQINEILILLKPEEIKTITPELQEASNQSNTITSRITLIQVNEIIKRQAKLIESLLSDHPEYATIDLNSINPTDKIVNATRQLVWLTHLLTGKLLGKTISHSEKKSRNVGKLVDSVESTRNQGDKALSNNPSLTTSFLTDDAWIHALTSRERKLLDTTEIMHAVGKLLRLKGVIKYHTHQGRAAKGPAVWMRENLIEPGLLTKEDVNLIPDWIFKRFDERLYQAIKDSKRSVKILGNIN